MKTNKEKFLDLVSKEKNNSSKKNKERIAKRAMLRESRNIAFKVLERLDELGWKQKKLAEVMEVSPPYVNKLVKGKENFTLETLLKLQQVLDIPILASYYKQNKEALIEFVGEEKPAITQAFIAVNYNINFNINAHIEAAKTINKSTNYLQAC
jgi:transcriptional regulator with XRE-family HTH domain